MTNKGIFSFWTFLSLGWVLGAEVMESHVEDKRRSKSPQGLLPRSLWAEKVLPEDWPSMMESVSLETWVKSFTGTSGLLKWRKELEEVAISEESSSHYSQTDPWDRSVEELSKVRSSSYFQIRGSCFWERICEVQIGGWLDKAAQKKPAELVAWRFPVLLGTAWAARWPLKSRRYFGEMTALNWSATYPLKEFRFSYSPRAPLAVSCGKV